MSETGALLHTYLGIRPTSTTEATLRLLIWTGLQILGADEGSLLVMDEATEDLRFVMTLGNEQGGSMLIGQRVPLGSGVTGLAAATREVQIGSPTFKDLKQSERVDGNAPEAVIAAPMLIDDRVVGVITGVSFQPGHRFDSRAGRMFGGFAVIAGVLVDQEQRLAAGTAATGAALARRGGDGGAAGGTRPAPAGGDGRRRRDDPYCREAGPVPLVIDPGLAAALTTGLQALDPACLAPVNVAVIDSGIDASHPDLAGRVVGAWRFEAVDGRQKPLAAETGTNNDTFGHGTGVASLIAQFAPNARLFDLRVLDAKNKGSGEALVAALRLAVLQDYKVINMSLACPAKFAPELLQICERAHYRGLVVVAARRNVPMSDEGFPAEFSSCIGVDTRPFGSPWQFAFQDGKVIELLALGEDVPVAAPNGGYTRLTGTSFATPTVSGMVARMLGAYPSLRPFEVRAALRGLAGPWPLPAPPAGPSPAAVTG